MKRLLTLLVLTGLLWSCSSDDDTPRPVFEAFNLKVYVPNAELPENQTYEDGEVVWSFDFGSQRVKVEVAEGVDAVRLNSGTYDYSLNDNVCNYADNRYFHVGDDSIGLLIMDDYEAGTIIISDGCIDGPIFTFERD